MEVTISEGCVLDSNYDLYVIGVKQCGITPAYLPKAFPKLSAYLNNAFKSENLVVGDSITWEEAGKHLVVAVTSKARLREIELPTVRLITQEITQTCKDFKYTTVGVGNLITDVNNNKFKEEIIAAMKQSSSKFKDGRITIHG
jgi:predicted phosphohydrolase